MGAAQPPLDVAVAVDDVGELPVVRIARVGAEGSLVQDPFPLRQCVEALPAERLALGLQPPQLGLQHGLLFCSGVRDEGGDA